MARNSGGRAKGQKKPGVPGAAREKNSSQSVSETPSQIVHDPKPLASYQLGYDSRMIDYWLALAWWYPQDEWQTWVAVIEYATRMDRAAVTLKLEIEAAVLTDLQKAIKSVKIIGDALHDAWEATQSYQGREFGGFPIPGMSACGVLRCEAERAFDGASLLGKWYRLGAAAGNYRVLLGIWAREKPLEAGLPDFSPVLACARDACTADSRRIPAAQALASAATGGGTVGPGPALRIVLGMADDDPDSSREDCYTIGVLADRLDRLIQRQLSEVAQEAKESSTRVGTERRPEARRQPMLEQRDKWIYEQCCKLTPYKEITAEIGRREKWEKIGTVPGIRNAAQRYAERHGLPQPPQRQQKR